MSHPPRHREPMPERFNELADYNGRRTVHVSQPGYLERMAALQLDFDIWQAEWLKRLPDAHFISTGCRICGKLWSLSDPGLVVADERPVLRCADKLACWIRAETKPREQVPR